MTIKFIIPANQGDPTGNPIPYERSTQRTFWNQRDRRYHAWKDYVRGFCWEAINKLQGEPMIIDDTELALKFRKFDPGAKPLQLKRKCHMHILATYKHNAHADTDNVWKGIADALFKNDKNVAGSFDFEVVDRCTPKVEVTITIPEENQHENIR